MTALSIAASVISVSIFVLVGLLFLGGLLLRHEVERAAARAAGTLRPFSGTINALRPLKDTIVEFITATESSRSFLAFLGSSRPLHLRDAIANAPAGSLTGLVIIALTGLVRLQSGHLCLTPSGREAARRIPFAVESDGRFDHPTSALWN